MNNSPSVMNQEQKARMYCTTLSKQLTSQAGNTYYEAELSLAKMRITINSKWKKAHDEAIKTKQKNKQPSFVLQVIDDKGTTQHSGKGAVWMFTRKEGRVHQGNMIINDVSYLVDIKRQDSEFLLQFTPREEISLSSL